VLAAGRVHQVVGGQEGEQSLADLDRFHVVFSNEVDDARAVYDALQNSNVEINREITYNEEEDYTEFSFLDPDGYEIGVYS